MHLNTVDPIFIGSFFGFLISIALSLFLAYWISDVKNKVAVVVGAFIGCLLGLLIMLGWAGTLIFDTPLTGANGASCFFGSLLFDSVLGLFGGILVDLLVARRSRRH